VEQARGDTSLTYFEFTTLAILSLMAASGLDVAVLEVGLGGRLDAVNVIDTDCAIITSIDIDHTELLGDTAKASAMRRRASCAPASPAIVSDPMPPQSVIDHATEIGADLWRFGRDFNFSKATAAVGLGRAGDAAMPAGLSGPARRQPAGERLGRAGGAGGPARAACRWRRRPCAMAWRWWSCRGASRSCPASRRWCWTFRTTRIRCAALGYYPDQPGRHGLLSHRHARRGRRFGAMADKDRIVWILLYRGRRFACVSMPNT
jgi:hypothetical protein